MKILEQEEKKGKSKPTKRLSFSGWIEDMILGPNFITSSWKGRIFELAFDFLLSPAIFTIFVYRLIYNGLEKALCKLVTLLKRTFCKNSFEKKEVQNKKGL
jgi:hypothetical protein